LSGGGGEEDGASSDAQSQDIHTSYYPKAGRGVSAIFAAGVATM
jgi:hypothetical protein